MNSVSTKSVDHITNGFIRWLVVVIPMALLVGSAVTLFLSLLESVTLIRQSQPWLLWLLPAGGAGVALLYERWGKNSDRGTRLLLDEIHEPGGGIPARMAPLVLLGTLVTHLFGGSAGREGTAVQMGGSIASALERRVLKRLNIRALQFDKAERQELLQAGIAAGFGAVFGTPITAAVFSIEVLRVRRFGPMAVIPCFIAAFVGHWSVALWGVQHTQYPRIVLEQFRLPHIDGLTLAKVLVASIAFGLCALLFVTLSHGVSTLLSRTVPRAWLRPVIGGCAVMGLTLLTGTQDYLGLGVTAPPGQVSIVSSFTEGGAAPLSWLFKTVFTGVTVGSGFKGGEVTPLFFVGASLGNVMSGLVHAPLPLMAALGFVAVFGAAANVPIACTVMGMELFGADAGFYFLAACLLAYLTSGKQSVYSPRSIPGNGHTSQPPDEAPKHESLPQP
ncbi:MAG: voltage-gated chloride channel family protein [Gemmatimonas sp.]